MSVRLWEVGQARLWMGVGAICNLRFYFGQCLLGEDKTRKQCEQQAMAMRPGILIHPPHRDYFK